MVYIFQLAIGALTELKRKKSVSLNVFEPDSCLNGTKIIVHRGTKNRNAKNEIDLQKSTMKI